MWLHTKVVLKENQTGNNREDLLPTTMPHQLFGLPQSYTVQKAGSGAKSILPETMGGW
jgi:hypothetical protein